MAVSAVRIISSLNSRRIICSYRSPLTSQLRYLRDRLTPINVTNCSFLQLGQLRFSRIPERSTSCYLFLRWNSSSSASSGFQDDGVSLFIWLNLSVWVRLQKSFESYITFVLDSLPASLVRQGQEFCIFRLFFFLRLSANFSIEDSGTGLHRRGHSRIGWRDNHYIWYIDVDVAD